MVRRSSIRAMEDPIEETCDDADWWTSLDGLSADARRALAQEAFVQLRPVCAPLLLNRNDRSVLTKRLIELHDVLELLDPAGLQGCMDYVLYPLMFVVDSIPITRGAPGANSEEAEGAPAVPAAVTDSVAEHALQCVTTILRKCPLASADAVLGLLSRLAAAADAPREKTSEEVRHKALLAIQALLTQLSRAPAAAAEALRQEANAPLAGYLISLLLKLAEAEARAGHTGSKGLRATAMRSLKLLVNVVRDGDALAFFVPGVASGLCKALVLAGTSHGVRGQTGAAASSDAAREAISGLVAILCATLGDASVGNKVFSQRDAPPGPTTATAALDALQLLAAAPRGQQGDASASQGPPVLSSAAEAAERKEREGVPLEARRYRVERDKAWVGSTSSRVSGLLRQALPPLLSYPHPGVRAALGKGVMELLDKCATSLRACSEQFLEMVFTLAQDAWPQVARPCREWVGKWARLPNEASISGAVGLPMEVVLGIASRLMGGMVAALEEGEAQGTLHARRLCTALQAVSPGDVASHVFHSPAQLETLCTALCRSLGFDRAGAALLVYASPEGGAYQALTPAQPSDNPSTAPSAPLINPDFKSTTNQPPLPLISEATPLTPSCDLSRPSPDLPGRESGTGGTNAAERDTEEGSGHRDGKFSMEAPSSAPSRTGEAGEKSPSSNEEAAKGSPAGYEGGRSGTGAGTVVLPRMPAGLALMAAPETYEAVANVARTAGRVAALAGGTALRALVDRLLGSLQSRAPKQASKNSRHGAHAVPELGWQLEVASVVTVIAEVIYGSSAAWQAHAQLQEGNSVEAFDGKGSKEMEALVAILQEELVQEMLWGVKTRVDASEESGDSAMTPQAAGENIMLSRALLEAVGVFALSVGPHYAIPGNLLRVTLLPVLERLGDPAAAVASSAAAAFGCICRASGYAGLSELVTVNADYVVDGLCAQLRRVDEHPRAPALFAVLLRAVGLGPTLMPLLGEPARAAIKGLAITARRKRPAHVGAFLAALREICSGARADAEAVLAEAEEAAADVDVRYGANQEAQRARRRAREAAQPQEHEESARDYFLRRLEREKRKREESGLSDGRDSDDSDSGDDGTASSNCRVVWSEEQWASAAKRRARCHADALLASAGAEMAGPLMLAVEMRVALLAMEVAREALRALVATQAVLDLKERRLEARLRKRDAVEPVTAETPTMLPHVHILWSPLLGALADTRVAVAERALDLLAVMVEIGGGQFMSRRVQKEAWPVLARLLISGPTHKPDRSAPPGDDRMSPAVLQRIRHAVLTCLNSVADSEEAAPALAGILVEVAAAVAAYIGDDQSRAVRERACKTLLSLARIDSDAIWSVLVEVAGSGPLDRYELQNPDQALFPPNPAVAPSRMAVPVMGASAPAGRAARARVLLEQVRALPRKGHTEVAAQEAYASAPSNSDDPFSLPEEGSIHPVDPFSLQDRAGADPGDSFSLPEGGMT